MLDMRDVDPTDDVRSVRDVPLLPDESIEQLFSPEYGRVSVPLEKNDLLVLTNQRIIYFSNKEGNRQVTMTALKDLKGATLRTQGRNLKYLFNGIFVIVAGLLTYFLVGYAIDGTLGVVAATLAGLSILLVGVFTTLRYLLWAEESHIDFHNVSCDITLRSNNPRANRDSHTLIEKAFSIKQGILSHHPFDTEY